MDYYQVQADGQLTQLKVKEFSPKDSEVFIIVENEARKIFLWKGLKAGVRQKFIGSRATGDQRKEYGYHYKIVIVDQGDEPDDFVELVRGGKAAKTVGEVNQVFDAFNESSEEQFTSYSQAAEAQGIDVNDSEVAKVTGEASNASSPGHIAAMGGIGARPQRSFLSDPNFFSDVKGDKKTRDKVSGVIQESNKEEAIELINALESPAGYDREMLIVGNVVYRVIDEGDDLSLEDLDNPLDGVIMVNQYTPRILAENGKIKAVELLKRTSEDIELDESLTQDLEDLTAMFQIEIE